MLNLPKNNEQVAFREPVNLFFQWTPQHLSMAGAMMFTEYEFILKELWDKERSPEAGFASTPEFYSETVKVPFLYYGAAHPLLMPGKRYAWAVRAKLAPGYEDAAEFVNKGFSEIRSFVFQPDCKVPSSCKTQILNDKEVLFRWQGAGFDKRFKVEYAENGISNGYSKEVEGEETVTLRGFKKGRSYQYRVGEFCMQSMDYVFSNPHSFEIPKDIKKREFNCGLLPPDLNITNRKAITELLENDEITAAGFPISLTRVSGQKKFSGEGYVSIPMLGYANVKVRFSNIQVNTDYQLIDGFIETTYDPEGKQVVSTDTLQQALAELKDQLELIIKEIEFVIGGTENIQVTENPEALTDSTASKYIIEVEGINGEKTQVAVDSLPLILKDADGNDYRIKSRDKNGNYLILARKLYNPINQILDSNPRNQNEIENLKEKIIKEVSTNLVQKKTIIFALLDVNEKQFFNAIEEHVKYLFDNTAFHIGTSGGWYGVDPKFNKGNLINIGVDNSNEENNKETLTHELLHHINYILKVYPYRYEDEELHHVYLVI